MSRPEDFPSSGDNFRTIGELALPLLENAARKQVQLLPGHTETANTEDSRNGSQQK